jgi:hypothetical protein
MTEKPFAFDLLVQTKKKNLEISITEPKLIFFGIFRLGSEYLMPEHVVGGGSMLDRRAGARDDAREQVLSLLLCMAGAQLLFTLPSTLILLAMLS